MWEVVKDSACSHRVLFVCCVPLCGHLLHLPELNTCKISHLILKHLSCKEQRSATHLHGVITTQCPPPHLNKCQSGWSRHNFFNNAIPLLPELQLPHSHHSKLHSSYIPIRVHPDGRQPHHQHPPPFYSCVEELNSLDSLLFPALQPSLSAVRTEALMKKSHLITAWRTVAMESVPGCRMIEPRRA